MVTFTTILCCRETMARFRVTFLIDPLLLRELGVELVDEVSILPRHDGVGVALEYVHLVSSKPGHWINGPICCQL